jgi:hypothetical protein
VRKSAEVSVQSAAGALVARVRNRRATIVGRRRVVMVGL